MVQEMVQWCKIRAIFGKTMRLVFSGVFPLHQTGFSTASRLPELRDPPSVDGAFPPPLPCGWR